MQKTFPNFIAAISHKSEYFQEKHLETMLETKDLKLLKDLSFLKRSDDLREIPCQSCDDIHFVEVRIEEEKLYYFCANSDIDRNHLELSEIATWCFDTELFLNNMVLKLGIDGEIAKLTTQDLWQIGGFSKEDTRYNCYYYQGHKLPEAIAFIEQQPKTMRRYILFSNKQEIITLPSGHELLCLDIKEFVELKKSNLAFNKKLFEANLIHGFRAVIFEPKNGDLKVNGKRIATITPSTPEYYFAELLWKNFNEPVSHKKIKNYIFEKTRKDYGDGEQKLAHKQKLKIKENSNDIETIDAIFKSTQDLDGENAYIMRNPI